MTFFTPARTIAARGYEIFDDLRVHIRRGYDRFYIRINNISTRHHEYSQMANAYERRKNYAERHYEQVSGKHD